jgi:EmrB/QacA subfamily drug resistance transporter
MKVCGVVMIVSFRSCELSFMDTIVNTSSRKDRTTMTHPTTAPSTTSDIDGPPPRRAWAGLAFLCLAELLLVIDITATNVALPTIARELDLGVPGTAAVVTAYIVTFGGLMLLGGRLADRFGQRRMLLTGLAVFVAASAVCGIATDGTWLIAGRALQGTGAALLSPAALAAVTSTFSGAARTRALGVWAGIGALGFAAGLIISGLLTAGPGWRWIFLANVPLGILIGVAFLFAVPTIRPSSTVRLDVLGGLLATVVAASLVGGLSGLAEGVSLQAVAALGIAAVAFVLFLLYERRHPSPLVRPGALRHRSVIGGLVAMLFASATMVGTFYVVSIDLQDRAGLDALNTGLAFLPAAVALVVSAHLSSRAILRFGPRPVGVIAFAAAAVGVAVLGAIGVGSGSLIALIGGLVLVCLGMGAAFVVATTAALAEVRQEDAGVTAGVVNTGHELGGALGVAAATAAFGIGAVAGGPVGGSLTALVVVAAGAALASILAAAVFPRGRVAHVANPHGH